MIPGVGGIGRKEVDIRLITFEVGEIKHRRHEGDSIELDTLVEQGPRKPRGARRSVAFANDELRAVPALVYRELALDCPSEGVEILVNSEKVLGLGFPDLAGQTCRWSIDENKIADIEQSVGIGTVAKRWSWNGHGIGRVHFHRAERTHVEPHRRGSRTSVEQEGERTRTTIGRRDRISDIEHARDRLALVVADCEMPGRCDVRRAFDPGREWLGGPAEHLPRRLL